VEPTADIQVALTEGTTTGNRLDATLRAVTDRVRLCRCGHGAEIHERRGPGVFGTCSILLCACAEFEGV
jgi:hypothetical protein